MADRPTPPDDDHGRPPPLPASPETEQALLGSLLTSNSAYGRVSDFLLPEHFNSPVHGRIFAAIGTLIERGEVANPITLKSLFDQDEALAEVGGGKYLISLATSTVTIVNAASYGHAIRDFYLRRRLVSLGEDIIAQANKQDLDDPVAGQIAQAEAALLELDGAGSVLSGGFRPMADAVKESLSRTEKAYQGKRVLGISLGLADLDRMLGGVEPTDLVVIGARPSMGKTALAISIAEAVAEHRPVAMFQLEQSGVQMATRALARRSGVSTQRQRRGEVDMVHWNALAQASVEISRLPIYIDDTSALGLAQIRQRSRKLQRQVGLGLIIIDHLQLIAGAPDRDVGRNAEVSAITDGLKNLAKDLRVPVVLLSQLSREVERREDKRPMLADLRDSGSVEQNADVVILLFREEYYLNRAPLQRRDNEPEEKFNDRYAIWEARRDAVQGIAEAIVAKQREGPTGTVKLHWDAEAMKFSDLVRDTGY